MAFFNPAEFDQLRQALQIAQTGARDIPHPGSRAHVLETLQAALALFDKAESREAAPDLIKAARDLHCRGNEIEIDESRVAMAEGEGGAWVQAWVWVPGKEPEEEGETEEA